MTTTTTTESITKAKADELRAKIKGIADKHRKSAMELCWALHESQTQLVQNGDNAVPCWVLWDYGSWEEYVGKELDLHLTTAYSYAKVWEVFYVELKDAWDPSLLLGITKMKILAASNELSKRNVESQLKRAARLTCKELVAVIYGQQEMHSFGTMMTEAQLAKVNTVLDKAKEAHPDLNRGALLAKVVEEWSKMQRKLALVHSQPGPRKAGSKKASSRAA